MVVPNSAPSAGRKPLADLPPRFLGGLFGAEGTAHQGGFLLGGGHSRRSRLAGEALLEGIHQVDDRRPGGVGYSGNFSSAGFGFNQLLQAVLIRVVILLGLERSREAFDQLLRQGSFLFLNFSLNSMPVFLGFGDHDLTADYVGCLSRYRSATDTTLFVLNDSAHCHNQAVTRTVLWDRVVSWIACAGLAAASLKS